MMHRCLKDGCDYRGTTYLHQVAPSLATRLCRKHHGDLTSLFARGGLAMHRALTSDERLALYQWFNRSRYFLVERRISRATVRWLLKAFKRGQRVEDSRLLKYRASNVERSGLPINAPRAKLQNIRLNPSTASPKAAGHHKGQTTDVVSVLAL